MSLLIKRTIPILLKAEKVSSYLVEEKNTISDQSDQDISSKIFYPEIRKLILNQLSKISKVSIKELIYKTVQDLKHILNKAGLTAKIYGRCKTPYSIWLKMQNKNIDFEQMKDVIAFRIIVNNLIECYKALDIISCYYSIDYKAFQDFISIPKINGYQSLHIVIYDFIKQRIEIQIRTRDMHQVAEVGLAAHWKYKQKNNKLINTFQNKTYLNLLGQELYNFD